MNKTFKIWKYRFSCKGTKGKNLRYYWELLEE